MNSAVQITECGHWLGHDHGHERVNSTQSSRRDTGRTKKWADGHKHGQRVNGLNEDSGARHWKMPTAALLGSLPVGINRGENEEHVGSDDRWSPVASRLENGREAMVSPWGARGQSQNVGLDEMSLFGLTLAGKRLKMIKNVTMQVCITTSDCGHNGGWCRSQTIDLSEGKLSGWSASIEDIFWC